jgi:hypothetical protein
MPGRAQAKHACENKERERVRGESRGERGWREYACFLKKRETWCVGGDNTIPQHHAARAQSQPTQEQISSCIFPFLSILALALALVSRRFRSFAFSRTQTHAQLVHRQAFNVFWRMSILRDVFEEREGFRRTRVTAGECSPNVS